LSQLVVVANRLPVNGAGPEGPWEPSPGGLVRAVLPAVHREQGAWVGWAGFPGTAPEPFEYDGVHLTPVALSAEEHAGFYDGMANTTLWPLYHDGIRPSVFEPAWWNAYEAVNRKFAEAAAASVSRGGAVWVHDYQLQLVPAMLRELRPDVRIGFFLHIPFPARELFARIPWREGILEGLLGADVIGFQRRAGAENFATCARELVGAEGDIPNLTFQGRRVIAEPHPISIDVREIESIAERGDVQLQADLLRRRLGRPRTLLLGVDRLDYTKGIDARLRAFASLLESGRLDPTSTVLVQVAVPTRGGVGEYAEMRQEVERLVGEINGRFASLGEPVVHYLHRNLELEDLVACYLAADVLLVTPFADGMNLVAKEFVAARVDDRGTLVLSEFAGAADDLPEAMPANPWDQLALSNAIMEAVAMPPEESSLRMRALRARLAVNDVAQWNDRFLARLRAPVLAKAS
jgi:alpha,alpha-trehalose-phosphate synthase [UDP-forming]